MAKDTTRTSERKSRPAPRPRKSVYLWEFLFGLLEDNECSSIISWTNKKEGIFVVKNTDELAKLWGTVKNKPKMDQQKMFRALRDYYNKGMLKKVKGSKGVYQFLFKPYEVRKDHQSVCKEDIAESLQDSLSNISEMISDFSEKERSHPKETGNNLQNDKDEPSTSFRNIILNNREFRVNNSEEKVENVGESSGNSSRTESLSRSSISTDRSCGVSLEDLDLHANLINADLTCDEVDCFFDDTHGSDIFPQWNID